ncbi:MAG: dehydrogenase [Bacteroidetes bacterium]|nr:dehydrogenase [Bacteroidota bacterium]
MSGLNPNKALSAFQIMDGFDIELLVAEPLVSDPVAMEIDELGNIYVVEMHGYPLDKKGSGIVKLITDSNGDGKPDKSQVFADGLILPTGIMKWKTGVIVADPPDILYLEDTNNDGKADVREVMITGFALSNPQHNANSPLLGIDNWIYIGHEGPARPNVYVKEFGDTGSPIRFPGNPEIPGLQDLDGSVRLKPDARKLEALSGSTQYGHTFDTWGHYFGVTNWNHIYHNVMAARYITRNPNLRLASATESISDHGTSAEVFPITLKPQHQLLTDVGVITSACGVTWYSGGLFPEKFNNVTFVAEPVHNLTHADVISDKGATFTAKRLIENREFLSSTDSWHRPVNFYIGPDGALYMMDYYRQYIEHPEWMSEEVANSGQLYNGDDKGRIYRITPTGSSTQSWVGNIDLSSASTEDLIAYLASDNIWWRRTAQRLLLNQNNPSTVDGLKSFIESTTSGVGLVHALWLLNEFESLNKNHLIKALKHDEPGVRENALLLSELYMDDYPTLINALLPLQDDPDPKVRYQLLLTLGNLPDQSLVRQKLLIKDLGDKWVQLAAISGAPGKELTMLKEALVEQSKIAGESGRLFIKNLSQGITFSEKESDILEVIDLALSNQSMPDNWWSSQMLTGLRNGLDESGETYTGLQTRQNALLKTFNENSNNGIRRSAIALLMEIGIDASSAQRHFRSAEQILTDSENNADFREDALSLLRLDGNRNDSTLLQKLINPVETESLQKLAMWVYSDQSSVESAKYFVRNWKSFTPSLRDESMRRLVSSEEGIMVLIDALTTDAIQKDAMTWPQKVRLMNNRNTEIKRLARNLLASPETSNEELMAKYKDALATKGDQLKGVAVFKVYCASCHQVNGDDGIPFGPDLGSIRNREKQFILNDIIDPNQSIADGYDLITVTLKNNETFTGVVTSETPTSIAVRYLDGVDKIIARENIAGIEVIETSAMPEGLGGLIGSDEMTDLLSFLKAE